MSERQETAEEREARLWIACSYSEELSAGRGERFVVGRSAFTKAIQEAESAAVLAAKPEIEREARVAVLESAIRAIDWNTACERDNKTMQRVLQEMLSRERAKQSEDTPLRMEKIVMERQPNGEPWTAEAVGKVTLEVPAPPPRPLTEEDVRRIAREEITRGGYVR